MVLFFTLTNSKVNRNSIFLGIFLSFDKFVGLDFLREKYLKFDSRNIEVKPQKRQEAMAYEMSFG